MKIATALVELSGLLVASLLLTVAAGGENEFTVEEDNVLSLTEDTFDKAVKQFKYLLVEFYAPWCARCKVVAPEFSKASELLRLENSEARLAKVDATDELELAEKYGIRSYPTVKFFQDGVASDYKVVGREGPEIAAWLRRRATGEVARMIDSVEEVEAARTQHDPLIVGFFKNIGSETAAEFLKVAADLEELTFLVTYNPMLRKKLNAMPDTVTVFKQTDEDRVDLPVPFTEDSIREFVEINRLPLIVEFGVNLAPKVFERKIRKHLILFTKSELEAYDEHLDQLKEVAKQFKGQVISIYMDVDEEANKKILDWFKLKRSDCPTVRLVDLEGPMNYKPDSDDWKKIDVKTFVQDVLNGKQKAYFISEDIPEDWDDRSVKILVGKNFDDIARDSTRNAFVFFYAPWCDTCKGLFPVWDSLGEKFKKQSDVVIAKIDATKNEVDGVKITDFPSFKFFPKNSDEVFTFIGNRTLDRFAKFVERGGKHPEDSKKDSTSKKDEL